jgi:hypothetical protein
VSIEIIKSSDIIDQIFGTIGSQENELLKQYREAVRVEAEARVFAEDARDTAEKAVIVVREAMRARHLLQEKLEEAFPNTQAVNRQNLEGSQADSEPRSFYGRSPYLPRDHFATKEVRSNSEAYQGFKKIFSEARDSQDTVFLRAKLDPQEPADMLDVLVRLEIPGDVGTLALLKYRDEEVIVIAGAKALGNVVIYTQKGIVVVHSENGYRVLNNHDVSSAYVLEQTIQYVRDRA